MQRRSFLTAPGLAIAGRLAPPAAASPVDFRYAPGQWQTAYCFPDDVHKSLVNQRGELLCGHPGRGKGIDYFPAQVQFASLGMEEWKVARQTLESPRVPIVHTRLERARAEAELIAFATNREGEGRVDNVLMEIRPRGAGKLHAIPEMVVATRDEVSVQRVGAAWLVSLGADPKRPFVLVDLPLTRVDSGWRIRFRTPDQEGSRDRPIRCFFRFPQENQAAAALAEGLKHPLDLLAEARAYWAKWQAFSGEVKWQLPGIYGEFLTACARNLLQAREVRDGRLTFQVGPTVYRGLWVVDGNFILESARYLGFDEEARKGLETTWTYQQEDGNLVAGGGKNHWKDTAIAMFSAVRQAELGQDWSVLEALAPQMTKAIQFLDGLREKARGEGGPNGKYGLLAAGMADGGLGTGAEFTNTVWTLAGLKAVAEAPGNSPASAAAKRVYGELRAAFDAAAPQQMRRHPAGFDFLPMLLKEDPLWSAPREWDRPRPQSAQWALSHAIYPGLVFAKNDPIVRGHIALMQACTQEDVPAETGWIHHEGLWTYNAPFVAHVYLWAGLADWARRTFHGFLNHASPLYCWREEQPLRGSLTANYVGDMPHNWASAECILYLRHMLALEDGAALRLLAGIGRSELSYRQPFVLAATPTRFGRLHIALEPSGGGWRLRFRREKGPAPQSVELPAQPAGLRLSRVRGASHRITGAVVSVDPAASEWEAVWA